METLIGLNLMENEELLKGSEQILKELLCLWWGGQVLEAARTFRRPLQLWVRVMSVHPQQPDKTDTIIMPLV